MESVVDFAGLRAEESCSIKNIRKVLPGCRTGKRDPALPPETLQFTEQLDFPRLITCLR